MPDPFRSREDLPKPKKKKKKKKKKKGGGRLTICQCLRTHTRTHTQKIFVQTLPTLALMVNWGGEKASPSFLFRLPPNQNLKNAEKPRERQVCPCNAYTTRAPSACASKLLYPQNGGVGAWAIHGILVRVPGREFRFLAPIAGQHLFLNLNQLILWRRIRICLLSFRQSCECCQTNGFARPVLRDRVSLATKVTCATAHSKVCSFCPHFRLFCSIIINFSKKNFCSPMIEVRILNRR